MEGIHYDDIYDRRQCDACGRTFVDKGQKHCPKCGAVIREDHGIEDIDVEEVIHGRQY